MWHCCSIHQEAHAVRGVCCMQGLRKHAGNYAQALHQVPRNNRHLYVHAYQSFLWNSAATPQSKDLWNCWSSGWGPCHLFRHWLRCLVYQHFASCLLKTLSLADMSRVGMHGITDLIASIGYLRFGHVILAAQDAAFGDTSAPSTQPKC